MAEAKVMVKGDTEGNPTGTPANLTERVTLYAPKGAEYHKEGDETTVSVHAVDYFLAKGYSKTAPKAK